MCLYLYTLYIVDVVNVDLLISYYVLGGYNVQNDDSPTAEEHLKGTPRGRRQIRPLLEVGQLAKETQSALKEEEERRRRLAEREKQRLEIERREREDADSEVVNCMVSDSVLFCIWAILQNWSNVRVGNVLEKYLIKFVTTETVIII